ncbi:hypothetical protein [Marinimicrobium agarilyticum]|uniref:hypothetical protein n=1 Tax=Marinimicrobium agarilyticum TaxID=306546 RepID=UPI000487D219|nr:hypothetical protein [Marinimicrobium agarilyticum]
MTKKNFPAIVILTIVYMIPLQACSSDFQSQPINNEGKGAKMECSEEDVSLKALPANVLVVTDIESIDAFSETDAKPGKYYSEMGGAEIVVSVEADENAYRVTRTFSEPTLPSESETFTLSCLKDGTAYGSDVVARFVEGGILWLETNPTNESLPSDLWIYLKLTP